MANNWNGNKPDKDVVKLAWLDQCVSESCPLHIYLLRA